MLTYDQKILMAQMIFNEKVILFSDFGPNLTKVEKQEKWMEIVVKLNSIGANIQDYKTLRDNEWSNMKRATEKKLSMIKANETKSEAEKVQCKPLSPIDDIVLDILGKGRGTTTKKETVDLSDMSNVMLFKYEDEEEMEDDEEVTAAAGGDATENYQDQENPNADTANAIPLPKSRKRKRPNLAFHYPLTANYELMELRKKKLQLECAKLELELEKMPLECAKLELEIQQLQRNLLNDQHNEDQTSIVQQ